MRSPLGTDPAGETLSPAGSLRGRTSGPWHCYVLECADGTLYTGITTDLDRRLAAHNGGKGARYTRSRLPVRLLWSEPHPDRAAATRREREIKLLPRSAKRRLVLPAG